MLETAASILAREITQEIIREESQGIMGRRGRAALYYFFALGLVTLKDLRRPSLSLVGPNTLAVTIHLLIEVPELGGWQAIEGEIEKTIVPLQLFKDEAGYFRAGFSRDCDTLFVCEAYSPVDADDATVLQAGAEGMSYEQRFCTDGSNAELAPKDG